MFKCGSENKVGYTHRWCRQKEIKLEHFKRIIEDFERLLPHLAQAGVPLGGIEGNGLPRLAQDEIAFNGLAECGHPKLLEAMANPWPGPDAGGVTLSILAERVNNFAGTQLDSRCCDGCCASEAFLFPRILTPQGWHTVTGYNQYRQRCETSFRPYDIAVNSFLIVAKHYLKQALQVTSDGTNRHWFDAKLLCQMELGYGLNFELDE